MKVAVLIPLLLLVLTACSHHKKDKAPAYNSVVSFTEDGKTFSAKVELPKTFKERIPLVIVVHEWWGKNNYPIMRAGQLTEQGYAAMAVDLYGNDQIVDNPKEAMAMSAPFYADPNLGASRLQRFVDLAKNDPHVDPSKIFVIGYCFGGTQALNLARHGSDVKGVVSFHGGLTPSPVPNTIIKTKILVLHGKADKFVPEKDVRAFKEEMKGVDMKFVEYPGATHAFSNPDATANGKKFNIPIAYNKSADEKSWNELLKFLKQ